MKVHITYNYRAMTFTFNIYAVPVDFKVQELLGNGATFLVFFLLSSVCGIMGKGAQCVVHEEIMN